MRYIGKHIFDYDASFRQKVGVGTDTPSEKIEVSEGFILSSGSGTSHGFELQRSGLDTFQIRHLDGNFTINNLTDTRKDFVIDGTGNVGIGLTNPGQKLQVSGDIRINNLILNDTGSIGTESTAVAMSIADDGGIEFVNDLVLPDNKKFKFGGGDDLQIYHDTSNSYIEDAGTGDLILRTNGTAVRMQNAGEMMLKGIANGAVELYHNNVKKLETSSDGVDITGDLNVSVPSTSSGIYAQFVNLKGFCTLTTNYQFTEDVEDTKSPFEIALDYGSATISSSTEVTQSKLFRSVGFHVPIACNLNAINMQVTCNSSSSGNITVAIVEYVPSELAADTNDHPRTIFEEVVVASSENNNKVKTVAVAVGDINNTSVAAGSHIMIMVKGDSSTTGSKAFISAAIEIKW
jgi:hypothetical protein